MSKVAGRIVVGLLFIFLGGWRVATDKGALQIFGAFMALYGVFSIGYGIWLSSKEETAKDSEPGENNETKEN